MFSRPSDRPPFGANRRAITATLAAAAAVPGLLGSGEARAQGNTGSTWDQIKRTGKVRMGVFNSPPYYLRDRASGQWTGALVAMGQDIAKNMNATFEPVEVGGWDEVVLALQSNKIDMHLGLQATPLRSTAIFFAGPIYWIQWVTVNNQSFHGKTWPDYNNPDVKVAVMTGSADEVVLRLMAPKATRLQMKELSEIILAVSSGRADAFTTTVLASMVAKEKNPQLGTFVTTTPRVELPGYAGIRMEDDVRWQQFIDRWAEWNSLLGYNEQRMRDSLSTVGIKEIPAGVSFSK
jgi:polar amino acid transport system substrate-binding protein